MAGILQLIHLYTANTSIIIYNQVETKTMNNFYNFHQIIKFLNSRFLIIIDI